jgi:OmpA-OmpF porin, OOP family
MTCSFTKKQMGLAAACALALGVAWGAARAETNPADNGYLTDQRGTVARSGYGLCWHTGTGPAPVSTIECDPNFVPAPIAKVVERTPQPVAVAAVTPEPAAKPVIERVTLDADALFDFDKAVLRPAGRVALDDFVAKIKGIDPEMIMAVGHADRFGSQAYNQRLSEQRVEAVRTYLVNKGIEPKRMQTEGKGETQPVTKTGDCDGSKSAKVIACLQPDRRVEVEVVGTRIAR